MWFNNDFYILTRENYKRKKQKTTMPCRVDGPLTPQEERNHNDALYKNNAPYQRLTEEIEKLTRFLCEYDREVVRITDLHIKINLSQELTEWLIEHRISDAKRKKNAMVDFEALAKKLGYNLKKIEIE